MPRAKVNTRSDTITPHLPAGTTVPDQAYGNRTAQAQSMKILDPMPRTPSPVQPGSPTGGQAPAPAVPGLSDFLNQSGVKPGDLPFKETPAQRRPITHGLPVGPGPGLEALGPQGQAIQNMNNESGSLAQLLNHLASQPNASSIVKALAGKATTAF